MADGPPKGKVSFVDRLDERVSASKVGKYFHLNDRKTRLSREVRAGIVTFLTACYILAVNSAILADTGGTCRDSDCTGPAKGPGCRFLNDPGYDMCVAKVRRSLVTATAATAAMSSFLMGAVANVPFAIMPGMGVNAYFAYTVVGYRGTGMISYEQALAAVFIEGWIFVLLSISGLRSGALTLVPRSTMLATAGGIGLFLAFIGLQKSEGMGIVVADPATLVGLGGCPLENQVHFFAPTNTSAQAICKMDVWSKQMKADMGPPSPNYKCVGGRLHSATMWLGISGFLVIVVLMARRVNGAIMMGILFTTFISWIPMHAASYLGPTSNIPGGVERMAEFRQVVSVPNAQKTSLTWNFSAFGNSQLWVALITFLYLDFLDATGTMYSMASMIDKDLPGFINQRDKSFPRSIYAFTLDGIGIVIGSLLGCAPLTVCLESAAGIREGGRTGITAIVAGFCFFIAMFFTPLIVSIPPYATGGALIIVGALMMESIVDVDWGDIREAVPAFLTIAIMPLTYSVAYGVIAGLAAHIVITLSMFALDMVGALVKGENKRAVLLKYTPEIMHDRVARSRPFKSIAALTGEQTNEEHARHFSEVKRALSSSKDNAQPYSGGSATAAAAGPAAVAGDDSARGGSRSAAAGAGSFSNGTKP
ncbi:adenine guanine permease [Raphidocelis subcapitata]|uniref:Adenine guanine permease n=1 Tax=Raphidocelis subcapitata TaxID=307507 RepID=A0A2V0P301_9CHLO|nr:adenine guanine permease [Raphidocelis subcapitata]|eukprot:GBF94236.1 adenine guanine permease [Raphidocelis subcapitata]